MAITVYPKAKKKFMDGDIDMMADTITALLLKDTAVYDSADEFVSDVIAGAQEISVAGYARVALTGRTSALSGVDEMFDADNTVFAALTTGQTIGAVVICKNTGSDATSAVVCWYDGGTPPNDVPKATNGGSFTAQWPATGILKMS